MNFYDVLRISVNATPDQIKSAYKVLAKKFHPDLNKSPDAADKFKQVVEAFETLIDLNKRSQYNARLPRQKLKPKKKKQEVTWSNDPNLGNCTTPEPPKFDIWGKPLSLKQQEEWKRAAGGCPLDEPQVSKKNPAVYIPPEPDPEFKDVFEKEYLAEYDPLSKKWLEK